LTLYQSARIKDDELDMNKSIIFQEAKI